MPRAMQRCGARDCDNPMPCKVHSHDARRPPSHKRYPRKHRSDRAVWAQRMAEGEAVYCRRAPYGLCVSDDPRIDPDQPWDLGHPDGVCKAPTAPEHIACNRATKGRPGYL